MGRLHLKANNAQEEKAIKINLPKKVRLKRIVTTNSAIKKNVIGKKLTTEEERS